VKNIRILKRAVKRILRKSTPARSSSVLVDAGELRRSLELQLKETVVYLGDLSSGTTQVAKFLTTNKAKYVVKILRNPANLGVIFRQRLAFDALREKLPIPRIRLATEQYIVEDYIDGIRLDRVSLGKAEEKTVFVQLGSYLRHIHDVHVEGFGLIGLDGKGKFPALRDYARYLLDTWLPQLEASGMLSPREFAKLIKYVEEHDFFLDSNENVMLHNDYESQNIKVSNGVISGVLDFADLASGPRALDLARPFMSHQGSDRFKYILQGYGRLDSKEIEYYAVLNLIWMIPYFVHTRENRKVARRLAILKQIIL
jgi:aminoglycoside phosphotransferase (APT) family kinase protein